MNGVAFEKRPPLNQKQINMEDLHDINKLPLGLWPQEDIDKAIDEILTDPIFDDVN